MKAAQIVAPRRFEIVDVDHPDIKREKAGSVLIKTYRSALCGSDMPPFVQDRPTADYPLLAGLSVHECIGTVAETNSGRFKEGDEVLSIPRDRNGLAEYFISSEDLTVALPDVESKDQMVMAQPLGTVIWACRKLGNLINRDVVLVGQGPMGLLMTSMLSNLGAKTIVAADLVEYRLQVANKMGATHTVNVASTDLTATVEEITDGRMADLVVEIVGHQMETINTCLRLVKRNGTVLAFGVPDHNIYDFRYSDFFRKNATFIGSVGLDMQNDVPLAMDMLRQGRIDVSPMITHHLPFTDAQLGFELSLHKKDGAIKVIFDY